jgi:signal transduction histidine kinase
MANRLEAHLLDAFAAETRHALARRTLLATGFATVLVAAAGTMEFVYFPQRASALLWSFVLEVSLCAAALGAAYTQRLRPLIRPILVAATLGVAVLITLYVAAVGASGDALAFALIIFLAGMALMLPWGMAGQVPLALGTVLAFGLALWAGVRGELPVPYVIISVGGGAVTSVLGAYYLDQHRRAIFQQRILLARTRDQQMATLYDVTRTVTATLELREVLWLVCRSALHALKLERLWLFWRESPDGDVQALAAERDGERIEVAEIEGAPSSWQALLHAIDESGPDVITAGATELSALGATPHAPRLLLRLPLLFQSELVGVVLADCSDRAMPLEASFLDFAATLGNGAAMALANARLHALVLHHRAELQQMSNKRLDVVEESIRMLSRELHDGTCQALMAIKLDLALLERRLETAELQAAVRDVRAQVVDVVQSVRQMSHLLRPAVLDDFGAVVAIESIAEKYRDTSTLDVRVESPGSTVRFTPAIELLLFRVFQETLINIVKHAAATRVRVRLAVEDGAVVLEIDDDGRGFDAHKYFRTPPSSAGLGLIGMRERIAHFGGVFRVTSRPGSGTRIFVSVPTEVGGEEIMGAEGRGTSGIGRYVN